MDTTVNSVCMHRIDLKQQYHRDIVPLRSKEKNNFRLREEEKTPGNCSAKEVLFEWQHRRISFTDAKVRTTY